MRKSNEKPSEVSSQERLIQGSKITAKTPFLGSTHISSNTDCISVSFTFETERRPCVAEASIFPFETGAWYLNRVLVPIPALRNQGVGSYLLVLLKTVLTQRQATCLIVEPGGYGADPDAQIRFYRRNGFRRSKSDGLNVYVWRPTT